LIVYVMLWSMFYTYRPNRLGGCYIIKFLSMRKS